LVSTYVASARNRAIETGRPAGVQFERMAGNLNACMVLHTVEVPPPYSGEVLNATCSVGLHPQAPVRDFYGQSHVVLQLSMPLATCDHTLIRVNDQAKLNYRGHTYRVVGPDANTDGIIDDPDPMNPNTVLVHIALPLGTGETPATYFPWANLDTNQSPAKWVGGGPNVPYQIIRQPVKSAIPALQLPEGAVVDLCMSGEGMAQRIPWVTAGNTAPHPTMVFEPAGTVGAVFHFDFDPSAGTPTSAYRAANAPIHFLMGRIEGVGNTDDVFPEPEKSPWNIRDPRNLWVSVGTRTGLISTAENSVVPSAPTITAGDTPPIAAARSIAMQMQSTGGR
jgi:hypothetical protein